MSHAPFASLAVKATALDSWRALNLALNGAEAEGRRIPCRSADPDLWHSGDPESVEFATTQCQTCPVITLCGAYGKAGKETSGIWGGKDRTKRAERQSALF